MRQVQVVQDAILLVKVFAMLGAIVDAKDVRDVPLFVVAIVVVFALLLPQELVPARLLQIALMPMVQELAEVIALAQLVVAVVRHVLLTAGQLALVGVAAVVVVDVALDAQRDAPTVVNKFVLPHVIVAGVAVAIAIVIIHVHLLATVFVPEDVAAVVLLLARAVVPLAVVVPVVVQLTVVLGVLVVLVVKVAKIIATVVVKLLVKQVVVRMVALVAARAIAQANVQQLVMAIA